MNARFVPTLSVRRQDNHAAVAMIDLAADKSIDDDDDDHRIMRTTLAQQRCADERLILQTLSALPQQAAVGPGNDGLSCIDGPRTSIFRTARQMPFLDPKDAWTIMLLMSTWWWLYSSYFIDDDIEQTARAYRTPSRYDNAPRSDRKPGLAAGKFQIK